MFECVAVSTHWNKGESGKPSLCAAVAMPLSLLPVFIISRVWHSSASQLARGTALVGCGSVSAGAVGSSAARRCGRQMPGVCPCYCILKIPLLRTSWCPLCCGNLFSPLPLLCCPPWRRSFILPWVSHLNLSMPWLSHLQNGYKRVLQRKHAKCGL